MKPLNTGHIDERRVSYRRYHIGQYLLLHQRRLLTIMIDAGYSYDRLAEKMRWLDIRPGIKEIITRRIRIMLERLKWIVRVV